MFWFLLPIKLKSTWTKQYNSNKLLQYEQIFTFTPEGLTRTSEIETASYPWKDLYANKEVKDGFCIYLSENSLCYIPKRVINKNDIPIIQAYLQKLPLYKRSLGINKWLIFYGALFLVIIVVLLVGMLVSN